MAVLGARQGSGVLLTQRLVLTASHVLGREVFAGVAVPGRGSPVTCTVIWSGHPRNCDAALLLAERDLVPTGSLPKLRWGALTENQAVPGCQVLGFPRVQRFAANELEAVQVLGALTPLSGRLRGRYVLHSDHHPPHPVPDGSPWAGLSGGPLFAGPVLIGIATEDPAGWDSSVIDAVPLSALHGNSSFAVALERHWPDAPVLEHLATADPADLAHETRYAKAVKARYSRMEVFGLDDLGTNENSWDLDTAYLSLEALAPGVHGQESAYLRPERQRIEEVLASRPRSVLRGEAGAGKTTLVWWLASHAVCRTMPRELKALDGLIPFVIPMRSLTAQGITTPTPAQLPTIAQLQVDEAPSGWAGRVLEAGRALLLVDGLDELPQAERGPARRWLADLLRMYPDTRCLVTVRPLAVKNSWLASEGFEELQLLPMSNNDIQSFVAAWHKAARLECDGYADELRAERERTRLTGLERDLSQEFRRNAGLRDLARTPLLCAVICALHRRRSGLLPRTRWHLYEAALAMLLGNRDAYRRVGSPEGIALDVEDSQQLLQRIAVWLVRNGRAELSHEQAVRQLESAMRGLRKVREQGTAEQILTHLLNRSGLLQERAVDSLQFIHRTFQDYLAAKEFQDSDSLYELLSHATEEQWQDVIRLVIGHCGRKEVKQIIAGLIADGDVAPTRAAQWPLRTLAAECAAGAAYLDDNQHDAVWDGLAGLGAPRSELEAKQLASLGPDVLRILPGPEGLSDTEVRYVADVLASLGPMAIPLLREYGQHDSEGVRSRVVDAWPRMDALTYASEVLSRMRLDDLVVVAATSEQLGHLHRLGPIRHLVVRGNHASRRLGQALERCGFGSLTLLHNEALTDVGFLREHPRLKVLSITGCPQLRDISALAGSEVSHLKLDAQGLSFESLTLVSGLSGLTSLTLEGLPHDTLPPAHSGVQELSISQGPRPLRLHGVGAWEELAELELDGPLASSGELSRLADCPKLHTVDLTLSDISELEAVQPLEGVSAVSLTLTEGSLVDSTVFRVFPHVDLLQLQGSRRIGHLRLDFTGDPAPSTFPLEIFAYTACKDVRGLERFDGKVELRDEYVWAPNAQAAPEP
ncbi:NACHT domain-containing protein [Streptomyces sp. SCA3-4]|uniref:NACHT domain-containing protein n=1 Tax=Streptomyces sichuanensis TaxID=2871810 RepID=UPI001CE2BE72|nr:NACHT domain-containing protein [Streptomyces sichuanensis]MCA6092343.1 NACHT domain-containing protein [Streptomyces sichuanensis]